MAEHGGFPLLQDCTADSSAPALPAEVPGGLLFYYPTIWGCFALKTSAGFL